MRGPASSLGLAVEDPLPTPDILARLRGWVDAGALRALDLALTHLVHQEGPETDATVLLAVALTSARSGHGHVCLDLGDALDCPEALLTHRRDDMVIGPDTRSELSALLQGLTLEDWVTRLSRSPAVHSRLTGCDDTPASPLVLDGLPERPLLYLRRYWLYEIRILRGIEARLAQPVELPEAALRALLDTLFAADQGTASDADDWQKIACALAARNAFAIITGGPGTGKTTTVLRLLALLQGLTAERGLPPLRIRLAAPTGKAAARLNASIAGKVADLPLAALPEGERIRQAIPTEVTTLHRLLGAIPESRHFRHHAGHPLAADLVVVDEASMVDVEIMACLLEALRPDARLILLGDKDQLASVEAGAVLGDLCQRARAAHYTPATRDWLQRVTGATLPDGLIDPAGGRLDQAIAMLRRSYRFRPDGGIGALAALINEDVEPRRETAQRLTAIRQLFDQGVESTVPDLGRIAAIPLRSSQDPAFAELVHEGYRDYLDQMQTRYPGDGADQTALDAWARAILEAQGRFQLLTALRQGPWGVEGLNRQIIEVLAQASLLPLRPGRGPIASDRHWFPGRPVLITRNDYSLGLMNGDIGITLAVPIRPDDGRVRRVPRVAFPAGDGSGSIRWILPSRLQAVETVFAMTVHKSQGSEFTHTALLLPDQSNPVITQELIYTGITRSRDAFTLLYPDESVLGDALAQRVRRVSGIGISLCH